MKKGLLVLAAALIALAPLKHASAGGPAFVGGGPTVYGGWYAPYWGPYWGPSYGFFRYYDANLGEVKLETKCKTAQVFVNGAYAGTTKNNRSLYLKPGSYAIEIRENGKTAFSQKIFVAAGKRVKLRPTL